MVEDECSVKSITKGSSYVPKSIKNLMCQAKGLRHNQRPGERLGHLLRCLPPRESASGVVKAWLRVSALSTQYRKACLKSLSQLQTWQTGCILYPPGRSRRYTCVLIMSSTQNGAVLHPLYGY